MSGRPTGAQVSAWADELEAVRGRVGRHVARTDPRPRAIGYVRGLPSGTGRENGWPSAEHLGGPTPDGVHHLLARADRDAEAVRGDRLGYAREFLGRPDGVPVAGGTGFLKGGTKSCGAGRRYSGTAGRVENGQVGVFLGHATASGRASADRASYLPKGWAGGADRRGAAGVPDGVGGATRIVRARRVIDPAVAAGVPARWVAADAVYGSDDHVRVAVEGHGPGYVVGVRSDFAVASGFRRARVEPRLAEVPGGGWHRHVTPSLCALAVRAAVRFRAAKPGRKKGAAG